MRDLIAVLEHEDLREVVLVGHSYGGMVISGVADRVPERLALLVYLDAEVPMDGQSELDSLPAQGAGWLRGSSQIQRAGVADPTALA